MPHGLGTPNKPSWVINPNLQARYSIQCSLSAKTLSLHLPRCHRAAKIDVWTIYSRIFPLPPRQTALMLPKLSIRRWLPIRVRMGPPSTRSRRSDSPSSHNRIPRRHLVLTHRQVMHQSRPAWLWLLSRSQPTPFHGHAVSGDILVRSDEDQTQRPRHPYHIWP